MNDTPDPTPGEQPPPVTDAAAESTTDVDPMPLAGAGGPMGGPVAGEVLDALNQPVSPPDEDRGA